MTSTGHEGRDVALTPVGADVLPNQDGDFLEYESLLELGVYFSEPRYKVKFFLWFDIRGESCRCLSGGVCAPSLGASPGTYAYRRTAQPDMPLRRRSTELPTVSQTIRKQPEADAEELLVRMPELGLDGVRRLVAERPGV